MSGIANATHPPTLGPQVDADPGTPADGEKQEHILINLYVLFRYFWFYCYYTPNMQNTLVIRSYNSPQ